MAGNNKSQSGLQAVLTEATLGTLIEGDAATPLTANTWYKIAAIADVGSVLPIGKVTAYFKEGSTPITPILGDDVYPVTLSAKCKVTAELTNEKGVIDVTDDCSDGYMSNITDGFTNISGSIEQFLKFENSDGAIVAAQKDVLSRFYDIVEDDGAGVYTVTSKNDNDFILFIFLTRDVAVGKKQTCFIIPTILGSANTGQDNKAGMPLSTAWSKAEGWAGLYERVLNVASDI